MRGKYILALYGGWCGLGFVRGVAIYNYIQKDKVMNYGGEPYMYSKAFTNGITALSVYANPILLPFAIAREIYRLEVNLSNLESIKKSSRYNTTLIELF